jgi:hypothetical protein
MNYNFWKKVAKVSIIFPIHQKISWLWQFLAQKNIILNFHLYHANFFSRNLVIFPEKKGNTATEYSLFTSNFHILAKFRTKNKCWFQVIHTVLCFLVHIMAFNDIYIFSFNYFVNSY